ncbi:hypothetical protein C8R44DRAFT_980460 [Mycena epipterygia]|nr:hypothetical protein C8R44DRAFT_980460 [Mycena epipterygia]
MEVINAIRSDNAAPDSLLWTRADPTMVSTLNSLRKNLHHASQSLSEDLYSKDSHFILELVQNADDNIYNSNVTPTLEIMLDLTENELVVACNETGFNDVQVRAICNIGASTKKHQQGYIGEKGIGFKSVFKVADKVFISSGPYKFFFDKGAELGMITPCWEEDCPGRQDWTQFTLQLSDTKNKKQLESYLSDIDPKLLLFLRKLRSLKIDLGTVSFVVRRDEEESGVVRLLRYNQPKPIAVTSQYLLVKRLVKTSSGEKKRPNISESEIILAFPLGLDLGPSIAEQFVHAFLPIRTYGFSFLIQGDFLTLANREDILSDSPWNQVLRMRLVSVFLAAIEEFQRHPTLALVWYRYIPMDIPEGFFSPFADSLLAKLKTMDLLRSACGQLYRPSQLTTVPSEYLDDTGAPLVAEEFLNNCRYLSSDYDLSDNYSHILYKLGVHVLSDSEFIDALSRMNSRGAIRQQSTSWHEAVSTQLRRLARYHRKSIMALRMVPLQDGSWVSLDVGDLFFNSEIVDIPRDLGVRLLERLDRSSSRFLLFAQLGVENADSAAISQKIMDVHGGTGYPSPSHVLNHAHFLFAHRDYNYLDQSDLRRLQVLNQDGILAKATNLYMDHEEHGLMPLSEIISSRSLLLHDSYSSPPRNVAVAIWKAWLKDVLHVNVSPRVIRGQFSFEFRDFLTHSDTEKILRALGDYWPRIGVAVAEAKTFADKISVICQDGTSCALSGTALSRGPLQTFSHLKFLPVDDPESERWNFLVHFGVTLRPDGLLYLKWLRRLSQEKSDDIQVITFIYKQLEARFDEDKNAVEIRNAFDEDPLIFVRRPAEHTQTPKLPSVVESQWLSSFGVVWNGPPSMVSKLALRRFHPTLQNFFHHQLQIPDCPGDILFQELVALSTSSATMSREEHNHVSQILQDISKMIAQRTRDKIPIPPWISKLVAHRIFPVRLASTRELQLRKLDETFYVPDRSGKFFEMFGRRVDMLELDNEIPLFDIRPLLQTDVFRRIESRSLDIAVSFKSSSTGLHDLDIEIQEDYLMRAHLYTRILHSTEYSQLYRSKVDLFQAKFQNLVVFKAESVLSTYTMNDLTHTQKEELIIQEESNRLAIFISNSCSPCDRCLLFAEQLAVLWGLNRSDLSMVMCTSLDIAARYLDTQGIGRQSAQATRETNDSCLSHMADSQVETTAAGWRTIRPRIVQGDIPQDSDSIEYAPTRRRAAAHLDTAALIELNLEMVSQAANRQSLSPYQTPKSNPFFMPLGTSYLSAGSESATTLIDGREAAFRLPSSMDHASLSGSFIEEGTSVAASRGGAPATPAEYVNGVLGEFFIFETLKKMLPHFTIDNWTSELRGEIPGLPPYPPPADSVADFRYSDTEGILTNILFGNATFNAWAERWPEYHIEVKSTSASEETPFHMSARQLRLASQYTLPAVPAEGQVPTEMYVLTRVWNIRSTPSFTFCPDPHRRIYTGGLRIVSAIEAVLEHL